jgi:hypothetical protein
MVSEWNGMFNGNGKWNEEGKAIGMVIFLQRSINKQGGTEYRTVLTPYTGSFSA